MAAVEAEGGKPNTGNFNLRDGTIIWGRSIQSVILVEHDQVKFIGGVKT